MTVNLQNLDFEKLAAAFAYLPIRSAKLTYSACGGA
jgi:hypothetical protein